MKVVIFAGGTGKRFWPASRKKSPKQFLNTIDNKPLVRLKYEYLRFGYEPEDILISTGIQYKEEVLSIFPELPPENFIFEPDMRDTGPAIALAVEYILSKFGDEVISLQWADHYIKDPHAFVEALRAGDQIVREENKTVIIGVPPRFASPHLGHIKFIKKKLAVDPEGKIVRADFAKFVEKPNMETAQEYMKSGVYLWNPGYLISKPGIILEKYRKYAPRIVEVVEKIAASNFSNESMAEFSSLDKVAFEYIFSENLEPNEATLLITEMGWSDVGEWVALWEALVKNQNGTVTQGNVADQESKNSLIFNYDQAKLLAAVGVDDLIIVNTPDAVAVISKKANGELKDFLKMLEETGLERYL